MPKQRDRQNFDEVVETYYDRIFRGALCVTGDKHLAEEIVQETFLSAFRKFDTFSGRSSEFSWLYTIMLNKYRDHCRKANLRRRLGFVRADTNPSETKDVVSGSSSAYAELANSEESELLMKAVHNLPLKPRQVIAMRYFDGLPLKEVAGILNCRLGTVKSRLSHARKKLWHMLQREFT